ncbi:hypothetical protein ACLMJK_006287 [Lecanora helva]
MELHVWGPAFTLPSIDPQCLATIAYLKQAVPKDQWVLIASSDPGSSPTKELPALRDGEVTVGGFENIIDYLRQKSNGKWDLDSHFTNPQDRADITAFISHLRTQLSPLLSLSLYISTQNYTSTTRPAYSTFLPWPTQFIIPPHHRSLAKDRTQHLDLSSLDFDTLSSDPDQRNRRNLADIIPASLRTTPKPTVTSLLKEQQSGKRFRLAELVDAACEPLAQLLGKKKCLLSEKRPSSLDCLALGYLALALKPDVPLMWLREGIQVRWAPLSKFVERGVEECWGGKCSVDDAFPSSTTSSPDSAPSTQNPSQQTLPWRFPQMTGLHAAGTTLLTSVLDNLPFSNQTIIPSSSTNNTPTPAQPTHPSPLLSASIISATAAVAAATAAAAGYFFFADLDGAGVGNGNVSEMGEAGAMLTAFDWRGGGWEGKGGDGG